MFGKRTAQTIARATASHETGGRHLMKKTTTILAREFPR
jgi:hypothetical protein